MKNRRKLGSSTQHHLRNIRIAVMGQDGVGKSVRRFPTDAAQFLSTLNPQAVLWICSSQNQRTYVFPLSSYRSFLDEAFHRRVCSDIRKPPSKLALGHSSSTKVIYQPQGRPCESTTRHHTEVNGEFLALDIQDTAGKNTEAKLQACLEFADIFLVLYSITDRASFHEAGKIVKYIRRRKTLHSSSIIIAATKRDLEHLRNVQETDGTKLTYSLNCSFYEISIADSFGETMDMFQDILRHYLIAHPTGEPSLSSTASTSPLTSLFPASPTAIRKEIKSSSSWTKVKGLKTMPFRKKSAQTAVC